MVVLSSPDVALAATLLSLLPAHILDMLHSLDGHIMTNPLFFHTYRPIHILLNTRQPTVRLQTWLRAYMSGGLHGKISTLRPRSLCGSISGFSTTAHFPPYPMVAVSTLAFARGFGAATRYS